MREKSHGKPTNERQEKALQIYIDSGGGSKGIKAAAEACEYTEGYMRQMLWNKKEHVLELTQQKLLVEGPNAAKKMSELVDAEDVDPALARVQLSAAGQVLDRIGVARQETQNVNVETPNGVFILPAKTSIEDDEED